MWYKIFKQLIFIDKNKQYIESVTISNTASAAKAFHNIEILINSKTRTLLTKMSETERDIDQKIYEHNFKSKIVCSTWSECIANLEIIYDAFEEFFKNENIKNIHINLFILGKDINVLRTDKFDVLRNQALKFDLEEMFDINLNGKYEHQLIAEIKHNILSSLVNDYDSIRIEDDNNKSYINALNKKRDIASFEIINKINKIYKKLDSQRDAYIISKLCSKDFKKEDVKKYPELIRTMEILSDIKLLL